MSSARKIGFGLRTRGRFFLPKNAKAEKTKSPPSANSTGFEIGVPTGIRTPVPTVKGSCPRPLDDRDTRKTVVEDSGIEPLTSCMPCKRSPS